MPGEVVAVLPRLHQSPISSHEGNDLTSPYHTPMGAPSSSICKPHNPSPTIVRPGALSTCIMCHRIVAEKVCEDCGCKMGEIVIDFDACSRRCTTPTYRLHHEPLELVCALCVAAWAPDSEPSTSSEDPNLSMFPSPFALSGHKRRGSSSSTISSISGI